MAYFNHSKFQQSDSSLVLIRKERLPNGYCIVFGLPLTVISTTQNSVDFDAESDRILEGAKEIQQHRAFQYDESGFCEVEIKAQKWFKF